MIYGTLINNIYTLINYIPAHDNLQNIFNYILFAAFVFLINYDNDAAVLRIEEIVVFIFYLLQRVNLRFLSSICCRRRVEIYSHVFEETYCSLRTPGRSLDASPFPSLFRASDGTSIKLGNIDARPRWLRHPAHLLLWVVDRQQRLLRFPLLHPRGVLPLLLEASVVRSAGAQHRQSLFVASARSVVRAQRESSEHRQNNQSVETPPGDLDHCLLSVL